MKKHALPGSPCTAGRTVVGYCASRDLEAPSLEAPKGRQGNTMNEKPVFEVMPDKTTGNLNSPRGIGRRQAMQRLFAGAGGALMVPGLAAGHPVHKHLADPATLAAADAKAAVPDWAPEYLDAHQNETLIALSERIVPGSTKAQVNRFIDLLLTVDSQESQRNSWRPLEPLKEIPSPASAIPSRCWRRTNKIKSWKLRPLKKPGMERVKMRCGLRFLPPPLRRRSALPCATILRI